MNVATNVIIYSVFVQDTEGRSVSIGPCARGVFLKYDSETPFTYFK